MHAHKKRRKITKKSPNMQVFSKKMQKNLHMSEKSSTFAPAFEKQARLLPNAMLNGVMVALQILVLSVWVRVLVEQHRRDLMGLFLVVIPTQTQVLRRFALSIIATQFSSPG